MALRRAIEIGVMAVGMGLLHNFGGWQLLFGVALILFPITLAIDRKASA